MKPLFRWITAMYPRSWRERYGPEFTVLIEDSGESWANLLNVFKGAVAMQMRELAVRAPLWKVLGVFAVVGAVIGIIGAKAIPARYVSTVVLHFDAGARPPAFEDMRSAVFQAVDTEGLLAIQKSRGLQMTMKDMKEAIHVASVGPLTFTVAFRDTNPEVARNVAADLTARIASASPQLHVLDGPVLPTSPYFPNVRNIVIVGTLAGLITGMLLRAIAHARV